MSALYGKRLGPAALADAALTLPELGVGVEGIFLSIGSADAGVAPNDVHPLTLTPDSWKAAVNGNWNNGANWSTGAAPTSSNDVTISIAGTYSVGIIDPATSNSVTLNNASVKVNDSSMLTVATNLTVTAGTFTVANAGVVQGGTISTGSAGKFVLSSGATLSGVTYDGTISVTEQDGELYVGNGFTMAGASGTGTGTINLTGAFSALYYLNTGTLNNATIDISDGYGGPNFIGVAEDDTQGNGDTLTLGNHLSIVQTGNYANVADSGYGGDEVVNDGTITADVNGGEFFIDGNAFVNAAKIAVSNGDTLGVSSTSLTNSGTISAAGTSTVILSDANFTDSGAVTLSGGSVLDLDTSVTAASLAQITNNGGTVNIGGTLTNPGTLTVNTTSTALTLVNSGDISGGVIADAGGGLTFEGGTLSGVTYQGALDLEQFEAGVAVQGGMTLQGASGTGPGTVNLTGQNCYLDFFGTGTLDNATINISDGYGGAAYGLAEADPNDTGGTLTLGSHLSIVQAGIYASINDTGYAGDGVVNDATITAGMNGGDFFIGGNAFTNAGKIAVSSGDTLNLSSTNLSNSGKITAAGTSTVTISSANFTDTGAVTISGSSVLNLDTSMTTASLAQITNNGGSVNIGGTLTNPGTLTVNTTSTALTLVNSGDISGGVIADAGGGLTFQGGTLSGVTYQGALDLGQPGAGVSIQSGITLQGASGTGTGILNLTGQDSYFDFLGTGALNNATINISDGVDGPDYAVGLEEWDPNNTGGTLTLGSHLSIVQAGTYAGLNDTGYAGDAVVNDGTITAGVSGGEFFISGNSFTNVGTIDVTNGDEVAISSTHFSSFVSGTLSGSYEVDAGSLLVLNNNELITTLAGTVTLSGIGSTIESFNTSTGSQATIDQRLTTINGGGALNLLAGRSLSSNKAFVDYGAMSLGGGTLTETSLTIGSGASLAGFGKVNVAVADGGLITASGGVLTLADALTGTGALQIDSGATLEAAATTTAQETITFEGSGATLKIDTPSGFASVLAGFGPGDVIDLAKTAVTSVSSSGTTIAAVTAGGTIILTLAAPLTNEHLYLKTDGTGGTDIVGYGYAQSSLHSPEPVAFGNHHVGDSVGTSLTLSNAAPNSGFYENLDAGIGGASAGVTASGSFTGLAPQLSNSSSLLVGLITTAEGSVTGTAVISLYSDGNGVDGFGTTSLGTQIVNVTGAVYGYAQATLANNGTVVLANTHVGQAVSGQLVVTNSAAAGSYSEALDVSIMPASPFSGVGSLSGVLAGSSGTLSVGYSGGAAGAYSGTETLGLVSDGTAIGDGLGTTTLTSQTVTVTGATYAYASGTLASNSVSLAITHVGQTDSAALTLTNGAAAGTYSEALDAGLSGASIGVTTSGTVSLLAAGATDMSSLLIGLNTSTSGSFSGTAMLNLVSDGTGIDGLGTTSLGSQTVTVSGIVDNYAVASFEDPAGPAISGSGTQYSLNLGSVAQGSAADVLFLGALNGASGLSDLLQGTISTAGGAGFTNSGFGTFSGLAAGMGEHSQTVTLATSTAGTFSETILLSSAGTNASGYDGALATETLTVTGTVSPIGSTTYALSAGPNNIVGADGGDLFIAPTYSLNSRDSLTGGIGTNIMQLSGGGQFDLGAPKVFANIPTITAYEGQTASGTVANTQQVVFLRDGSNETVNVVAGTAAKGDTNPESIVIYSSVATNTINLASGSDQVFLSTGNDTVVLGGAKNSVVAGGGTALVQSVAANASASVVGTSVGTTTLEITNAGTVTLNAADTYLTVKLDAATKLTLDKMGFITANGGNGGDTLIAGAANQTLIGGTADILNGYSGGSDLFSGASAALNGDTIDNWITGDTIDLTDMSPSATLSYSGTTKNGKLTISDGTHKSVISFTGSFTVGNFSTPVSDGHSGALISYVA